MQLALFMYSVLKKFNKRFSKRIQKPRKVGGFFQKVFNFPENNFFKDCKKIKKIICKKNN